MDYIKCVKCGMRVVVAIGRVVGRHNAYWHPAGLPLELYAVGKAPLGDGRAWVSVKCSGSGQRVKENEVVSEEKN